VSTLAYAQIIAADTEEQRVDQIGLAILREQARAQGLAVVGDVTRTSDKLVYSVPATGPNGEETTMLVGDDPLAADTHAPAGRIVRWEAEVRSADPGPIPTYTATKVGQAVARLTLPEEIAKEGGLIEVEHGLGGEVTATARTIDGTAVNYRLASAISDDKLEIDLIAGLAASIEIVLDVVDVVADAKDAD
jgi:hypothetical protein